MHMATLTIRNLPDAVRDKLRLRAAAHGRSMEAEARALLEAGVEAMAGVREMPETYEGGPAPEALDGLPSWVGALKGQLRFDGTAEDWAALDKEIERDFLGEDDDDDDA